MDYQQSDHGHHAKLACVFGNPIEQSKSPIIHTQFAEQFNIPLNYQKRLAPVDGFEKSANAFFSDPQCIGANVTMPFKDDAYRWVDSLSEQAQRAGAVNTIIRADNGFIGDNTDGIGLCNDLLNHNIDLANAKVLMIGAGGAAKGALPALIEAGVKKISLFNRNQDKALALIEHTKSYSSLVKLYQASSEDFDLVINATSLSLQGKLPDLPNSIYENAGSVYDMVYKDEPTVFLAHAKSLGCGACIDGLGMLIEQAAFSFYLWFGEKPNTAEVMKVLRAKN